MANPYKSVVENVPGDFFVDATCIDCDTFRQLAPAVFGEAAEFLLPGRGYAKLGYWVQDGDGFMPDESQHLLARLRVGDSDAAAVVHDLYVARLVALARSRLSQKMARRIDPEDVVQSVYRSFFAHAGQDEYVMERGGDMWRLLSAITINKVLGQVERHQAKKRSIAREEDLTGPEGASVEPLAAATSDPTPEQALALVEELEAVMQQLDPQTRRALEMRLQGEPVERIARDCDCSERTVRRALEKSKKLLETRLLESNS